MEIKREGENIILSFELVEAQSKLDCGISLENFFKRRAEKFEFGENDYYNMVKKEIEYINQNTEDFVDYDILGRPFWTLDNISLEVAKKIIDNLQKLDYTPPKPFEGLLMDLNDTQLDKLFEFLTTLNNGYSKPTFIDKETTDRQSFNYIFGNTEKPNNFIPIEWKANNYYLGDILKSLQVKKTYSKNGVLQLSNEVKRQAAKYFNKDGKPITTLQKSKNEAHTKPEYKAITKFLATI